MKDWTKYVVCPVCQGPLSAVETGLYCSKDQLTFPIREGIPVMLKEEATSGEKSD